MGESACAFRILRGSSTAAKVLGQSWTNQRREHCMSMCGSWGLFGTLRLVGLRGSAVFVVSGSCLWLPLVLGANPVMRRVLFSCTLFVAPDVLRRRQSLRSMISWASAKK